MTNREVPVNAMEGMEKVRKTRPPLAEFMFPGRDAQSDCVNVNKFREMKGMDISVERYLGGRMAQGTGSSGKCNSNSAKGCLGDTPH